LNGRIAIVDGAIVQDRERRMGPDRELILFRSVRPSNVFEALKRDTASIHGVGARRAPFLASLLRLLRRTDVIVRAILLAMFAIVTLGALYYHEALHLDPLTALYFVVETMTTTGYGDVPVKDLPGPEIVSMLLMVCGVTFTGVFVALLASQLTRVQWVALQGLRRIRARGHMIVCGAGNVGSRVIEYLLTLDQRLVVIELNPRPAIIEASRDRRFDLLTADATDDSTLELCSVEYATALVALTHSDTMNLEVALSIRARRPNLPIVMRVIEGAFAASVARHFGLRTTFAPADLAAPAIAGLAFAPGSRGRFCIGERDFAIAERFEGSTVHPAVPENATPLCVWRDRRIVFITDFAQVGQSEFVLYLVELSHTGPAIDEATAASTDLMLH